ncbi:MAG: thiamine-phosphate kinase [Acidiferrobacter sp.]
MDEFALITRFFQRPPRSARVAVGIGDDAALIDPGPGRLAVTTDTLVAGVHFLADAEGYDVGYKALAVNLSDLAAMGARPCYFLLNLAVPVVDEAWLEGFSRGLWALADPLAIDLIGGDTVRGPLSITITAIGELPADGGLRRDGAHVGDHIYVTGYVGDAALGFYSRSGRITLPEALRAGVCERLNRPAPRVAEGLALQGIASAAIDISDGLVADLNHVLVASGVGADIDLRRLPLSAAYDRCFPMLGFDPALTFGDDYELCFTLPPDRLPAVHRLMPHFSCGVQHIGDVTTVPGLRLHGDRGLYEPARGGFNHFDG